MTDYSADSLPRRRREFIVRHHPDRGGDSARFIAGLAALDADADAPLRVTVVRRRGMLARLHRRRQRQARKGMPPRVD